MTRCYLTMLVLLVLSSCETKTKDEPASQTEVAKERYFWIDERFRLHQYGCSALRYTEEETHGVIFVKASDLEPGDYRWYCPRCIDIETYENIEHICHSVVTP